MQRALQRGKGSPYFDLPIFEKSPPHPACRVFPVCFLAQYSLASSSTLQSHGWDPNSSNSDEMSRTWIIYACARSGMPMSMNQYRATFCNCYKNFYTALAFDFEIFSIISLEVSLLVFWKAAQVCFYRKLEDTVVRIGSPFSSQAN